MAKTSWAKGRKEKFVTIAVSEETRDMIKLQADLVSMTMKDFLSLLLHRYDSRAIEI